MAKNKPPAKEDRYQLSVYLTYADAAKFRAKAFEAKRKMADIIREMVRGYVAGKVKL